MDRQSPGFIGGLTKGTEIFNSDGSLVPVEEIKVGSLVLSSDGSFSKVSKVLKSVQEVVSVTQTSNHYAHLRDKTRLPPWGLVNMKCSKRQTLHLRTRQRIKIVKDFWKRTVVEVTQLRKLVTEDGRTIDILKSGSKQFPVNCLPDSINEYIDGIKIDDGFIEWECEVNDLKYLNKELRASTRAVLAPLSLEKPVLLPWLEEYHQGEVTLEQLRAMAWLLGFWIGDGSRRGAVFALHSGDHDVNNHLKMCAELWGMKLRIAFRSGFGACGYLHTFHNGIRRWNVNNPLIKVLEGLKFYANGHRNGKKIIPLFMRSDQRIVREAFMAGLIDSDGSVNIQENCIRAKIPTAYTLIRDGILFIGNSLGLNVTVHFYHSRENANGYHQNDLWVFHLFGGSNHGILWSILSQCSCERKRNPPVQLTSNGDAEEFEQDDDDLSENESSELNEGDEIQRISQANHPKKDPMLFLSESEEDGEDEDEDVEDEDDGDEIQGIGQYSDLKQNPILFLRESEENEDEAGGKNESEINENDVDNDIRYAVIRFEVSPAEQEQVYGIVLSRDSHQTVVTDRQVICSSAQLVNESNVSNPSYQRKCLSCREDTTLQWYKLPWQPTSADRLCSSCYEQYSRSKTKCCKCCKVYSKTVMQQKSRRETKVSQTLEDGTFVQGYACVNCEGVIVQDGEPKTPSQRDSLRAGNCYSCRAQESTNWRKVPWKTDREWCSRCRSRYSGTATICTKETCLKIPFKGEFNKMAVIDAKLGHYRCLKCGSIAKKNMEKLCRNTKKVDQQQGTCYSCGSTASKRWSKLPWDKKADGEICLACYLLLRAYKGRCLDPSCRKIFKKAEIDKMKTFKPTAGPSPSSAKVRPCITCQGMTTVP